MSDPGEVSAPASIDPATRGAAGGGRRIVAAVSAGIVLIFAIVIALGGWSAVAWVVPMSISPPFLDMYTVTTALDTARAGGDPAMTNPLDPFGRPFNYPSTWLLLRHLGLTARHTAALGVATAIAFLLAVTLAWDRLTPRQGWAIAAILVSPAVLLGLERGNVDLLMFALVAMALRWRRGWLAPAMLGVAGVLKVFPAFAAGLFMGAGRALFWRRAAALAVVMILFAVLCRRDLAQIQSNTLHSHYFSYGASILPSVLGGVVSGGHVSPTARAAGAAMAGAVLLGAGLAAIRTRSAGLLAIDQADAHLAAFRAAAGIYLASFLLVPSNWNYRLAFQLLAMPQWVSWCSRGPLAIPARLGLAALLYSCWIDVFRVSLYDTSALLADEAANWLYFAMSAYLLCVTLPAPEWRARPAAASA